MIRFGGALRALTRGVVFRHLFISMRVALDSFDRQFDVIDERSRKLLDAVPDAALFAAAAPVSLFPSPGVCILRSAAIVEQTFLGLTRRLWDDPFEWTLPEKLSNRSLIAEYLNEVSAARADGMAFLTSDDVLARELPAPERLMRIGDLLFYTVASAEHYLGRAAALIEITGHIKLPRV